MRRFDEVKASQASVTESRCRHLAVKIETAVTRPASLRATMAAHDEERSGILKILKGKGAFEMQIKLKEDLGLLTSARRRSEANWACEHA